MVNPSCLSSSNQDSRLKGVHPKCALWHLSFDPLFKFKNALVTIVTSVPWEWERDITEKFSVMSRESSKGNAPVTIVTSVPWERERDITVIAVITAHPAKRRSVSDSDVIVAGSAFILPLELVIFACFATIGQSVDWREPIGLQERLEGRSSHNGEILCDVSWKLERELSKCSGS